MKCVPLTISYPLYFPCISKFSNMLHHKFHVTQVSEIPGVKLHFVWNFLGWSNKPKFPLVLSKSYFLNPPPPPFPILPIFGFFLEQLNVSCYSSSSLSKQKSTLFCMKFITKGTGAEGIKKWMVLYFSWNFQAFKEDLALWVALVYNARSNNSQYNNVQFMYI